MRGRWSVVLGAAIAIAFAFVVSARQSMEDPNQRAIAAIRRLLQQRPNDPTLYFNLGAYQAAAGARDDSLASLRKTAACGKSPPSRISGDSSQNSDGPSHGSYPRTNVWLF